MSKQYKIKWKKSDNEELTKVVRNFNAKITRLAKKDPKNANALPDKVSVKELKELINTRKDLKRELNSLRRFSKRGQEELVKVPDNDYNLLVTKWQRSDMNRRAGIINRKRKARLEHLENLQATSRGKPLGYTLGNVGMGSVEKNSLRPTSSFTPSMTRYSLKMKMKMLRAESQSDYFKDRDRECRDNYLKGIKMNYNWEDIKDIYEYIEKMPIDKFMDIFYQEGATFEFASPDGKASNKYEEYLAYESELRDIWMPEDANPIYNSKAESFVEKREELDKLRKPVKRAKTPKTKKK